MLKKTQSELAVLAQRKKELIDEYGRLDAELIPVRAKLRRVEELGRAIRSMHAEAIAEHSVTASGDVYEVVLGPAAMQTKITDLSAAFRLLGRAKFLAAASITLKALEQHADAAAIAALTTRERTGPRTLVVKVISN